MADLGKFLVGRGIIGPEQLAEAAAIAKNNGGKVHEVLVKQGYATSKSVRLPAKWDQLRHQDSA